MAIALGGVQLLSHGPFSLHAVMLEVGRRWNLFAVWTQGSVPQLVTVACFSL